MSSPNVTAAEVVERFIDAYNAQDFDALASCLAPELDFQHYNRGFSFTTAGDLVAILTTFAREYLPDRTFGPALRLNVAGDVVYREHRWTGTLAKDLEGFGAAGYEVDDTLCSVFTVQAGVIVQYYDYG